MSLLTILASIANQLEKIMGGFHWVNWDEVYRPKQEGGLGIKPLRIMNDALKIKWLGRFAKGEDSMWKNVIKVKYEIDDLGWWTKSNSYSHRVSSWKSISTGL